MKKTLALLVALIMMFSLFSFNVSANHNGIKVLVNGQQLVFDVQPQVINGRTMVPMRKIFESLGAVVSWDETSKTVTGKLGDLVINITLDTNVLFKNGVPKTLDVAPTVIDGRTLVPVRAIAESLDCIVDWLPETQTVQITKQDSYYQEKTKLSASAISDMVSPSVFYIEVYDEKENPIGSGSGFFISGDGVAVTNYHVIEDTSGAKITTVNGDEFEVTNIIAYDTQLDVAIIKINKTSINGKTVIEFPCVAMANSDEIKAGQTVYAIGSPVGLQNTISNGIISNVNQKVGEENFIQITAPISHGSSGGALVNEYGEVLGITSAGIDEAQNIGFAIPINIIKLFDVNAEGLSYRDFSSSNETFTILAEPQVIEMEVGESKEILVYAEGKGDDWSIYWHTEEENLVYCEWQDWLEDYENICPLTITAINAGTATITVYSDVDFKGIDITVYIKRPYIETYPYSNVPTYTAVTGTALAEYNPLSDSDFYGYYYNSIETPKIYMDYLVNNGFEFYKEIMVDNGRQYLFITPDGKMLSVVVNFMWNLVWISIQR